MSSTTPHAEKDNNNDAADWMSVVVKKIQDLRFGSVQVTVHDGRVTLVESIEKTRFTSDNPQTKIR